MGEGDPGRMWLVTGATGFVGTNLCRRLERLGLPFRALVRNPAKAARRGFRPEVLVEGDLLDPPAGLGDGVEVVAHCAGLVRAVTKEALYRANEGGTAALCRLVEREAPGARFVHISSLAAAGPSKDGERSAAPPEECRPVSNYGASKLAGERVLLGTSLSWIVLRPGIVYGPYDRDVRVLFAMAARGRAVAAGPSRSYSLVFVGDLVEAVLAAADRGGRSWLPVVATPPLDTGALFAALGKAVGRETRLLRLPALGAALTALGGEAFGRLRGRAPRFGWDKWREMRAGSWVGDPEPAREVLGFEAGTPHAEGFRATARWYFERGLLPGGGREQRGTRAG